MYLPPAITALDALEKAVGDSLWTYPAIVAAVGIDSVLPLAPLRGDRRRRRFALGHLRHGARLLRGSTFEESLWKPLLAALLVAVAVAAGAEGGAPAQALLAPRPRRTRWLRQNARLCRPSGNTT